jgi:hypothetical protein
MHNFYFYFILLQIKIPSRFTLERHSTDARRSLFTGKRLADDNTELETPATKKSKGDHTISASYFLLY